MKKQARQSRLGKGYMREKIRKWIKQWESRCYSLGITDEAPSRLESSGRVPSYRTVCLAILKNDVNLKSLGFSPTPCTAYMAIKRIEIEARKPKDVA